MFSVNSLMELLKAVAKSIIVGGVAATSDQTFKVTPISGRKVTVAADKSLGIYQDGDVVIMVVTIDHPALTSITKALIAANDRG